MSVKDKAVSIGQFFGPHYAMERFSAGIVFFALCFIGVIVWVVFSLQAYDREIFDTTKVYEESVTGSMSGVIATPVDLWTDEEGKRAVFMFKFDNMANMSARATDYNLHMTAMNKQGSNKEIIRNMTAGSLYLYGSTGYAAVYMVCPSGFEEQKLRLIIEGTKDVTGYAQDTRNAVDVNSGRAENEAAQDASETEETSSVFSDVFAFTINPGIAKNLGYYNGLDNGFDVEGVFRDFVMGDIEERSKTDLETDLAAMEQIRMSMDEYMQRLSDDGIVVNNVLPEAMANDKLVRNEDKELELESGWDFAGALHLDWRNDSLNDGGYFKDVDTMMSLSQYLAQELSTVNNKDEVFAFDEWKFVDGRRFIEVAGENASEKYTMMAENMALLESSAHTYLETKVRYQTTHQRALLELELQGESVQESVTAKEDCLDIY